MLVILHKFKTFGSSWHSSSNTLCSCPSTNWGSRT